MTVSARSRIVLALYLACYFCLLAPAHLTHFASDGHDGIGLSQGCDDHDPEHHHRNLCPTCQCANDFFSALSVGWQGLFVAFVFEAEQATDSRPVPRGQASPEPRAPPLVG